MHEVTALREAVRELTATVQQQGIRLNVLESIFTGVDVPVTETPADTHVVSVTQETPVVEAPVVEAPVIETPVVETPPVIEPPAPKLIAVERIVERREDRNIMTVPVGTIIRLTNHGFGDAEYEVTVVDATAQQPVIVKNSEGTLQAPNPEWVATIVWTETVTDYVPAPVSTVELASSTVPSVAGVSTAELASSTVETVDPIIAPIVEAVKKSTGPLRKSEVDKIKTLSATIQSNVEIARLIGRSETTVRLVLAKTPEEFPEYYASLKDG